MSYKPLNLRPLDVNIATQSAISYSYTNRLDPIEDMLVPGYFSKTIESDKNVAASLKPDDLIYLVSGDPFDIHGSLEVKVRSVDPIVVVSLGNKMRDVFIAVTSGGATSEEFGAPSSLAGDIVLAVIRDRTPTPTLTIVEATMKSDFVVELFFNGVAGTGITINIATIRTDLV